jgi:GGDEF domain-containing protein
MTIRKQQQELLQQKELLQKMSITDDLTGLYNRRHLNTHLTRESEHCKRYKIALSCIMLDLDHFIWITLNRSTIFMATNLAMRCCAAFLL